MTSSIPSVAEPFIYTIYIPRRVETVGDQRPSHGHITSAAPFKKRVSRVRDCDRNAARRKRQYGVAHILTGNGTSRSTVAPSDAPTS